MRDFEIFERVCILMSSGKHKEISGIKKIIHMATQMNTSGKRKYKTRKLLEFLQ